MNPFRTVILLIVAAIAEVGGAYLIWQWIRVGKSPLLGIFGGAALIAYGLIQTLQIFSFGRIFAAYGGVFITTALIWGFIFEGKAPDRWDLIGAGLAILGAGVILWAPRS